MKLFYVSETTSPTTIRVHSYVVAAVDSLSALFGEAMRESMANYIGEIKLGLSELDYWCLPMTVCEITQLADSGMNKNHIDRFTVKEVGEAHPEFKDGHIVCCDITYS